MKKSEINQWSDRHTKARLLDLTLAEALSLNMAIYALFRKTEGSGRHIYRKRFC